MPAARRAWRAFFVAALVVATVLALMPAAPQEGLFPHVDKVKHFLAFAALAVLGRAAGWPWRSLAVGLSAFGIAIEVAQGLWTETRQPSAGDVVADVLGIAAGLAACRWSERRATRWRAALVGAPRRPGAD